MLFSKSLCLTECVVRVQHIEHLTKIIIIIIAASSSPGKVSYFIGLELSALPQVFFSRMLIGGSRVSGGQR